MAGLSPVTLIGGTKMTSAEKIISGIIEEAKVEADSIIAAAEKQAEEMVLNAKNETEVQTAKIISDAEKSAELIVSTGKSGAGLIVRDATLAAKRDEIERVLNEVVARINAMPDDEYFAFFASVAKKSGVSGKLHLSKRDAHRNVAIFKEALVGTDITVSESYADTDGGFVLKCGDIEINAEPSALVKERMSELVDCVNGILFE